MSVPVTGTAQFQVTPEDLTNAATDCTATNAAVQTMLSSLGAYVLSMEDEWKGSASSAFQLLMTEFNDNASLLNNALQEMAMALTQSAGNYSGSDAMNARNVTTIGSAMPAVALSNFS